MQAYLSLSPTNQMRGKMGPIKWNEIGIAGYAIVDTWMYYHCKILNSEQKAAECMKCFDTENAFY